MNEYVLLKDYQEAEDGLLYSSPCRGLWNIVHLATQVPGSHQIYVCPTSCLRGVVLTTAEMGCMDRLSTITVGEDNILDGDMEERILEGTRKILSSLNRKPAVVFIFTSCIHHFMAANYLRVYEILRKEYPDIAFIDAYMDPIMRKKTPPLPSLQRQVYRVFKNVEKKEKQCNFIDNWFSAEHNDLALHLKKQGIVVKDFSEQESYDSYLEMQESCCNFSFHKFGMLACKDMFYRLHQPYLYLPLSFDYSVIDASMKEACQMMRVDVPTSEEIEQEREKIEELIVQLKQIIGNTPIVIDHSAIDCPMSLACFLIAHGFCVKALILDVNAESSDVFNQLKAMAPDMEVYNPEQCTMRIHSRKYDEKMLGIGQQAAYFFDTPYFVELIFTAGMYGYHGIQYLLKQMMEAYEHPKHVRSTVSHKGWRCQAHG